MTAEVEVVKVHWTLPHTQEVHGRRGLRRTRGLTRTVRSVTDERSESDERLNPLYQKARTAQVVEVMKVHWTRPLHDADDPSDPHEFPPFEPM